MKIEGDYLVCNATEAESYLRHRVKGDQLNCPYPDSDWRACEPYSDHAPGEYHPAHNCYIRRLITACSPELLERAGYRAESMHFL